MDTKGFSLIELLIVIAIIAILAGIAIPQYTKYKRKTYIEKSQELISSCIKLLSAQYLDNGTNSIKCSLPVNPYVCEIFLDSNSGIYYMKNNSCNVYYENFTINCQIISNKVRCE